MKNRSVNQFEVRKRLQEAFKGDGYLITVTTLDRQTAKLNHFYAWDNFPADDVIPSLAYMAGEVERNEGEKDHTEPAPEPR